jgi:hypothetical protein
MSRPALPIAHYELKLYEKYVGEYIIIPTEYWKGVRTNVEIYCEKHKSKRSVWLQKVFNGKNSIWPCRQCYLDSLKHPPTDAPPTENIFHKNSCGNHSCKNCQVN